MTVATGTIPTTWQRAMNRARANRLHAERVNNRMYAVRSVSHPGTKHLVRLDTAGRIIACDDCLGWRGRQSPCHHAGAVASRILRESVATQRQQTIRPVIAEASIESSTTRAQLYPAEAVA